MNIFMGIKIATSPHATRTIYNWPIKARSKRLIKKLTKLRGQQVSVVPTAYQIAATLELAKELECGLLRQNTDQAAQIAALKAHITKLEELLREFV